MRSKLIAAGVSVAALVLPASAMAQGGGYGQAQFNTQEATTLQAALSHADANQNGVNTNAPVNVAGGDVRSGDNSANQNLSNDANSTASNDASTTQNSDQSQSASSPGPSYGSGGSGQFQANGQEARTGQLAASSASAHQNGVNANVPVNIAGGDVSTGDNSANQKTATGRPAPPATTQAPPRAVPSPSRRAPPARRTGPAAPANSKRMAKRRAPVSWRPPARRPPERSERQRAGQRRRW